MQLASSTICMIRLVYTLPSARSISSESVDDPPAAGTAVHINALASFGQSSDHTRVIAVWGIGSLGIVAAFTATFEFKPGISLAA
jgi:hypothetical protein